MPHITAGLLNLNQADLTIDVLDKLARLPDEWAIQLILVDNGSDDAQVQQLSTWLGQHRGDFAEVLFVTAFRNLGADGGRNVILKLASGEALLTLDNDVVLPDDADWLATLWQLLESDPSIGLVGPMLVFADYRDIIQGAGIGLTAQGRVGYLHRGDPVDAVPPTVVEVVASPAACWLIRPAAQQAVGLFSNEFYPVQYEDVDFCVRIHLAGWKILCDRSVRIQHIENVTTRNLPNHTFARLTVRQGMKFKKKWADILPKLATITEKDIYWAPIPRTDT